MAEKPTNLVYGADEKPPAGSLWMLGFQHLCVVSISLVFPVLVVRSFGGTHAQTDFLIDMTLLSMGIGAILQALKRGPVGSGYLCPQLSGPSFVTSSMMAGHLGGLPLIFGMNIIAGVTEGLFSRLLPKLRKLFPSEVTGLIVAMVGITVIPTAMRIMLGHNPDNPGIKPDYLAVGIATMAVMIGLNVWTKGKVKLFCVILGMASGYAFSAVAGLFQPAEIEHLLTSRWVDFPLSDHPGWSFDARMILPVVLATLCSSLKTVGDLSTCQRINDSQWKRPDMENVQKGVLADGLGCLASGVFGGLGMSTSSSNIGLSIATGATSRYIAFSMGALAILAAFSPKLASIFTVMPEPVMGSTMIFSMCFMVVAGFQMVMSRMTLPRFCGHVVKRS